MKYKITLFFKKDPEYESCMTSARKTCKGIYEVGQNNRMSFPTLEECQTHCNENNNCKFIFYKTSHMYENCLRYSACDQLRITSSIGTTYSKGRNCPGNS